MQLLPKSGNRCALRLGNAAPVTGVGLLSRPRTTLGVWLGVLLAVTFWHPRVVAQTYTFTTLAGSPLSDPSGIVVDSRNYVFVSEVNNPGVRQITPAGLVSTFTSEYTGTLGLAVGPNDRIVAASYFRNVVGAFSSAGAWNGLAGRLDTPGIQDGAGTSARFRGLHGVVVDSAGNIYATDSLAHTIRKVTPLGEVTTLAGLADTPGSADGTGSSARFNRPAGIAIDKGGALYVTDFQNHTVRRITPAGVVTTLAGAAGQSGSEDGTGMAARFNGPIAVAVDQANYLFVADLTNATIRRISPTGSVATVAGAPGQRGQRDGVGSDARFSAPYAIAVDAASNLYIADAGTGVVRKGVLSDVTPGIVLAPQSRRVVTGEPTIMSVAATGPGPLAYQWRHNGQVIPGATSATLVVNSTKMFDAGYYDVTVSNSWRQTTSAAAWLTVAPSRYPEMMAIDPPFAPRVESINGVESIRALVRQPDGKLIVGGHFVRINGTARAHLARLNPDGTVDPTFDPGVGPDDTVYALALQPDGKVIVAGAFLNYNTTSRNRIARVNADGSLDASFNPGTGLDNDVFALALQDNGTIVLGGQFATYSGTSRSHVARANADGSLDRTLDVGRQADIVIYAIAVQPDGKVLFRGREGVLRVNTDGSPDSTFSRGTATDAVVGAIVVLPDGKVLVGSNDAKGAVIRLNSSGVPDQTFSAASSALGAVWALAVQSDGTLLIGGSFTDIGGFARGGVARLTSNGRLDAAFAPLSWSSGTAYALTAMADGEVVAAGAFQALSGGPKAGLARYRRDGTLDADLGSEIRSAGRVETMVRQPDGKLLIGGAFNYVDDERHDLVARLEANGTLDPSFSSSVRGGFGVVQSLLLQPEGSVLIGGNFTEVNGAPRSFLARVDRTGALDPSFGSSVGADAGVIGMDLQPDGKIVLVGSFQQYGGVARKGVARIQPNGSLDTSFDPGRGAGSTPVNSVIIQPDGRILVGGWFTSFNMSVRLGAARLLADGSLDVGFIPGGGALPTTINTLLLAPDGAVYLGGVTAISRPSPPVPFARLLADGNLDASFDRTDYNGTWVAGALLLQADGKLLVGQSVNSASASPPVGFGRYTATGAQDASFQVVGLQPARISRMIMLDDGSLLVAGARFSDGRVARFGVARVVAAAAPAITSQSTAVFVAGRANAFKITTTGAPRPTMDIKGSAPKWLTWNPSTGLLGGIPPRSAAGSSLSLTASAGNGVGNAAVQTLTLLVQSDPVVVRQPASLGVELGSNFTLSVAGEGDPAPGYQWRKDGMTLTGATTSSLTMTNVELADAGAYDVVLTNAAGTTVSEMAVVGVLAKEKVSGDALEVASGVRHPNGNIYDQVLLTGPRASVRAAAGKVTRVSYVDLNDDIVQVEFTGAGSLTISLSGSTGPDFPVKYNQQVRYMKGHASMVVAGANDTTYLAVFSVGRVTAFTQDLFREVYFDGVADMASIAISSANGKFGALRAGNGSFFARRGSTGIVAPGVQFAGPIYFHDLNAFESASPLLIVGASAEVGVTGGSLLQSNGRPVQVGGIAQIQFRPGANSHGLAQPAQDNQARFEDQGVDVTDRIVVNPTH